MGGTIFTFILTTARQYNHIVLQLEPGPVQWTCGLCSLEFVWPLIDLDRTVWLQAYCLMNEKPGILILNFIFFEPPHSFRFFVQCVASREKKIVLTFLSVKLPNCSGYELKLLHIEISSLICISCIPRNHPILQWPLLFSLSLWNIKQI